MTKTDCFLTLSLLILYFFKICFNKVVLYFNFFSKFVVFCFTNSTAKCCRGIINWIFPLKLLLLIRKKSWFCEGIYLQQALQVISWISYPRGSVQRWPGSEQLWFRVLLAWVMCELHMTWCTREFRTAPSVVPRCNSRCTAEPNAPKGDSCTSLQKLEVGTSCGCAQMLIGMVCGIDLDVVGSCSLEKPSNGGGIWGADGAAAVVVVFVLSSSPGRLCPDFLRLLLLLCALRAHWYLQSPKCSGIFVFAAGGRWVPSVPVPYRVNNFASEKSEGRMWEDLLLLDQSEIFPKCLGIGD